MNNLDITIEDRLYDKTQICPICKSNFKSRGIKKGKTSLIEIDMGLRAIYKPIIPECYQVIICDNCGYASISKNFSKLGKINIEKIITNINKEYKPKKYPEIYTRKIAIERFKTALYFSYIKEGETSEKAYIAQKISNVYSDMNKTNEQQEYINLAYKWYEKAMAEEEFPILDMQENQYIYNLAYLAYKQQHLKLARKLLSELILKKDLEGFLSDRVDIFKELIRKLI